MRLPTLYYYHIIAMKRRYSSQWTIYLFNGRKKNWRSLTFRDIPIDQWACFHGQISSTRIPGPWSQLRKQVVLELLLSELIEHSKECGRRTDCRQQPAFLVYLQKIWTLMFLVCTVSFHSREVTRNHQWLRPNSAAKECICLVMQILKKYFSWTN